MIASCYKKETAAFRAKRQSNVQSSSALKIISAKPSNPNARAEMRLAKTVARLVNRFCNHATTRLWHLPHLRPKGF